MFRRYAMLIAAWAVSVPLQAEWRDPTQPGNLPPPTTSALPGGEDALELSAVWISPTAKRATINGETLVQGQTLANGGRLVNIRPHSVLVKQNGALKKLELVPSVKKPLK